MNANRTVTCPHGNTVTFTTCFNDLAKKGNPVVADYYPQGIPDEVLEAWNRGEYYAMIIGNKHIPWKPKDDSRRDG